MEPGLDLDQVSRETPVSSTGQALLAVIAEQQGVITGQQGAIAELRQRVESLEARLSGGGLGARMPGHKPAARRKRAAGEGKKPRRKRQQGFARLRMEPTGRVVHAPESCPECHTTLSGGWVQRTREVIELPVCPAEVTEYVFIARTCPLCRKRRLPQDPLKGLAVGRQRLGVNPVSSTGQALSSLIVTLREEARLPVRTIQWYLRTFHHLIAIFFLSLLLRGAVGLVPYRRLAALRPGPAPWGAVVSGVVRGPPAVPGWPGPAAVCGSGPSCPPG